VSPKQPKSTPRSDEDFSFAPENPRPDDKTTGRVKFDDRGNAVWEWSVTTDSFSREASTDRIKKLEHPALSIADDVPPADGAVVKPNPLGTKKGYNPYDSGKLGKGSAASRKKDLRRLGEWLKLKKQVAVNKKVDKE
jgi:hypothetical protein